MCEVEGELTPDFYPDVTAMVDREGIKSQLTFSFTTVFVRPVLTPCGMTGRDTGLTISSVITA